MLLPAAAISSTSAAFCWVTWSICCMASLTWAIPWICSSSHTAQTGLTHVPYKSRLAAIQDVIGARLNCGFGSLAGIGQFMQQGQLRPLAVLSPQRNQRLAMNRPDNASWLQSNGFVQIGSTPQKQAEMARQGRAAYDPLARAINIHPK